MNFPDIQQHFLILVLLKLSMKLEKQSGEIALRVITFYSIILIHKRALRCRTRSSLSDFFKSIQQFGVSVEGIEKLKHLGWDFLIVSAILIVFLCVSCGSETNKEPLAEVPQIIKSPILGNRTIIWEVTEPPTLSLIESPVLKFS